MTMQRLNLFLFASLCWLWPTGAWSQSTVHTNVSDPMVEKILLDMNLKYKKGERKLKDTSVAYYDFEGDGQPYRLYNYHTDLWLECLYEKPLKLEDVNRWNAEAKFSRAVLIEQKDKSLISLETQLDCLGGVTDAMIKQFVNRFDEERKKFVKTFPK